MSNHKYAAEFLFSKDGTFPRYIDSYKRPAPEVQRALGLRELNHHALGRHSLASQAVIQVIAAQLVNAAHARVGRAN
jgi:hypothetical protein